MLTEPNKCPSNTDQKDNPEDEGEKDNEILSARSWSPIETRVRPDACDRRKGERRHENGSARNPRELSYATGRPNGSRLSCGALKKDSFPTIYARRQLQALVRPHGLEL